MAKRLKLRLTRILSNCRSKNDPFIPLPIPSSSAIHDPTTSSATRIQTFRWKQERDFHVISMSTSRKKPPFSSSDSTAVFTPPRPLLARRGRQRYATMQRGKKHPSVRFAHFPSIGLDTVKRSRSRAAEYKDGTEEKEDQEKQTENIISSVTSSDNDDGCSDSHGCIRWKKRSGSAAAQGMLLMSQRVPEVEFEARLSVVERMLLCGGRELGQTEAEEGWGRTRMRTGKVRESYAVVKRTQDPYGEFRRSMMEMVTAKEMNEEEELRELLWCLLSLNSREHHGIILRAFAEVWNALFRNKMRSDWDLDLDLDLGSLALISN